MKLTLRELDRSVAVTFWVEFEILVKRAVCGLFGLRPMVYVCAVECTGSNEAF